MENDNTQDIATVEETLENNEIFADALIDAITSDEPAPQQEEPDQEPQQDDVSPEQAQRQALESGIQALYEDGWTAEDLQAFANDPSVRADIKAGKDIMRAAAAYERRQRSAAQKPAVKKGVPTVRKAATEGVSPKNRIEAMSDEEFARFSDKMYEEAMAGKRIRF